MVRRLNIELDFDGHKRAVGQVAWVSARRVAAIEWDSGFIASPLPLSPYSITSWRGLHFGQHSPFEGLPGLLADSLPDGWGKLLVDRELVRRGHKLHELTPIERLAIVGQYGMGALSYQPEQELADGAGIDLDWFAEAVRHIEGDVSVDDLHRLRAGSGGSAGARPKFVTLLNPETGMLRDYRARATTGYVHFLVKFRSSVDSVSAPREEQAYAEMARAAGIRMPETRLLSTQQGEDFFAARRFDWPGDGQRLHMHTVAGILNADFTTPVIDYEALLQLTEFMTNHRGDVEEMFRRMVFNVMAHNRDDHIKNHAFLMDQNGIWRLSPAYDLSFSDGPGGEHNLSINGNGRNPTREDMVAVGIGAGIKRHRIDETIEDVDQVVRNWPCFAETHNIPSARINEISQRLASVRPA